MNLGVEIEFDAPEILMADLEDEMEIFKQEQKEGNYKEVDVQQELVKTMEAIDQELEEMEDEFSEDLVSRSEPFLGDQEVG
jgi:hypothetical protein